MGVDFYYIKKCPLCGGGIEIMGMYEHNYPSGKTRCLACDAKFKYTIVEYIKLKRIKTEKSLDKKEK